MANWAYIENNEIKELHDNLPKSWKNISGLRFSENDIDFLNNLGWVKVTKDYEDYDKNLYREIGFDYKIHENQVIESIKLIPHEQELTQIENINNTHTVVERDFQKEMREKRNKLLQESDWTQLLDVQSSFDDETKWKWSKYRQSLRDFPSLYTTNLIENIEDLPWPNIKNYDSEWKNYLINNENNQ